MRLTLRSPAVAAVLLAAGLLGTAVAVAARSAVTPPPAIKSAGQIVLRSVSSMCLTHSTAQLSGSWPKGQR